MLLEKFNNLVTVLINDLRLTPNKYTINSFSIKPTMDILRKINLELSQEIMMYLTTKELCQIAIGIPEWKHIVNSHYIWYERCKRHGYVMVEESKRSEIYKRFLRAYPTFDFQVVYIYNQAVYHSWKYQNCVRRWIKFTKSHYFLHYFDDEILIFGTVALEIIVYNNISKMIINRFRVCCTHSMRFQKVVKCQNYLICFGCSSNLHIWNLDNQDYYWVHRQPGRIHTVVAQENLIVIIRDDRSCKVMNMNSKSVEYETDYVNCTCFGNDIITFGRQDGSIDIVNLNYKLVTTLKCNKKESVHRITISGNNLIAMCLNQGSNLYLWNIKSRKLLHTINRSGDLFNPCFINENTFTLCKDSHSVEVMDFREGTVRCVLENYDEVGYVILNAYLILAVNKNSSKIMAWSRHTQKFVTRFELKGTMGLYNRIHVTNTKLVYTTARLRRPSDTFTVFDFEANIDIL